MSCDVDEVTESLENELDVGKAREGLEKIGCDEGKAREGLENEL